MVVFIILAVAGFIFLLLSWILGEIAGHAGEIAHDVVVEHDISADHPEQGGPGVFSPRVASAFLTGFGASGAIGMWYHLTWMPSSIIGLFFGVVTGALSFGIARFMYKQQASSGVSMFEMVGLSGTVSVAIPAGGVGQVTLVVRGSQVEEFARAESGQEIKHGTPVKVVKWIGSRLIVSPL